MAADDEAKARDSERTKLLEEIRKRAEEAEIKRIEEEERKAADKHASRQPVSPPPQQPPPVPVEDIRVVDLRQQLTIALDKGKTEKASELLAELRTASPNDSGLVDFTKRLTEVQGRQQRAKETKRTSEPKPKEDVGQPRIRKEVLKKKVATLFENANSQYQQEKYETALNFVTEVLTLEPENEEALGLREQIDKARQLAARIKEEEAQRRAARAAEAPPAVTAVEAKPPAKESGDVWGNKEIAHGDPEYTIPPEADTTPTPQKPPMLDRVAERVSKIRIPLRPVLTVLAILVALAVGYYVVERIRNAVFPPKSSVLIFPAEAVPADTSIDYLTEGISEELINSLNQVPEIRVLGIATSLSLMNHSGNLVQTARSVGANSFLQWRLTKVAEGVDLAVSLLDTVSGSSLWSSQFHVSMRELPTLLNEIARTLFDKMEIELTSQQRNLLSTPSQTTAEAYDAFLRARYFLRHIDRYPVDSALHACENAVHADSLYADAHVALSTAHVLAFERTNSPRRSHLDNAARSMRDAVALGSKSSETYRVRGIIEQYRLDYDKAVQLFEEAVAIAPSDAEAQRRLSIAYVIKGQIDQAVKAAERAVSDDPRNVHSHTTLGLVLQYKGEYTDAGPDTREAALHSYEEGLKLASDRSEYASAEYADVLVSLQLHDRAAEILNDRISRMRLSYVDYYKLARVYQLAGKPILQWQSVCMKAKDIIEARLGTNPGDGFALSYLALVHTLMGEFKEAIAANVRAQRTSPEDVEVLYNTARMFQRHGDKTQCLEYLKKAMDRQYRPVSILDMDFSTLRSDPDFLQAITK